MMGPAPRPGLGRAVLVGALGAVATRLASAALTSRPPGGAGRWTRTNHAGDPVSLLEGPAYVAGVTLASAPAGPAAVVAALGGGGVGVVDDLATDAADKGFRGHLTALRHGRVTTGSVKIVGMALTGVVAVVLAQRRSEGGWRASRLSVLVDTLVGGAVVAGTGNLVNLFDLRPGRALKVVVLTGVPLALGGPRSLPAAAAAGAALGALPEDLDGRSMLGDTGANAAGAVLGTALVASLGPRGRLAVLLALAGLTAASEKVSFTRVIESTPVLREIDAWGRPT